MSGPLFGLLLDARAAPPRNDAGRKAAASPVSSMNGIVLSLIGIGCSIVWLVLLVSTDFSPIVISMGLLAAVLVTGSSSNNGQHSGRGA